MVSYGGCLFVLGYLSTFVPAQEDGSVAKKPDMLEFEYARSALKNGLRLERTLGANPYKFGLIGSSDAHTGLAAMEEDNFFGKTTPQEPSPERMHATFMDNPKSGVRIMDWQVSSSGYAAVWAKENTRASLWDAMQRRETYATTGPRMAVRFFGGYDFVPLDATSRSPAIMGYTKGIPMGGDLKKAPAAIAHAVTLRDRFGSGGGATANSPPSSAASRFTRKGRRASTTSPGVW